MYWVPNKGNIDQSCQIGKLQHMAMIKNQSNTLFFRSRGNLETINTTNKIKSNTNKRESTGTPTVIRWNNI